MPRDPIDHEWEEVSLQAATSPLSVSLGRLDANHSFARIEVAVKQILCGMNVKTSASVANAHCLEWYRGWAQEH